MSKAGDGASLISDACKFGLHMRVAPVGLFQHYDEWPRVNRIQVEKCFFARTLEMAAQRCVDADKRMRALVFVASDAREVKHMALDVFRKAGFIAFESGFKASHVDNDLSRLSEHERKQVLLETVTEWLVLASMNQLVISRSGFSEQASVFRSFAASRQNTIRLLNIQDNECHWNDDYFLRHARAEDYHGSGAAESNRFKLK